MKKIAVFASGNGSNFQALFDATQEKELNAEICLLICDQPNAYVLERAALAGIEVFSFSAKAFESKEQFETKIKEKLQEKEIEWIFLAGYMRLIGDVLLKSYGGRIINIHPSLLPSFKGKDAIGQALEAGVSITGITVHFVDEGMDTGPIIAQEPVSIIRGESKEQLSKRMQKVEHALLVQAAKNLLEEEKQA